MKLFLIRHGESQANIDRVYAGHVDTPLTGTGIEQAMAIRPILEKISFDRVYTSDLHRAWDTQKCEAWILLSTYHENKYQ